MKRILQITSSLERNGTETFIMNVLRNIDSSKFQFDFLLNKRTEDGFENEAKALGARIYSFPSRAKGWKNYISSLKKFFHEHQGEYSAVHFSGMSFTELMPVKIAKQFGVPIRIVHSHSSSTTGFHNKILHYLNKKIIHKTATDYFACSPEAKQWGFVNTKVFENVEIIRNGIELNKYEFNSENRNLIRKELSLTDNQLVIGHTGGFRTVKNHPFLLKIFEEIRKSHKDSVLLLCGKGETLEEIKLLVSQHGLENSVKFLGVRSDINKILSAIDIYIFPSFYEGLPFALIEAQASGLPVLASDSISRDVCLTPTIMLKSLNDSPEDWAKEALKLYNGKREIEGNQKLFQYDIKKTCEILEKIYDK